MREKNTLVLAEAVSVLAEQIGAYGLSIREGSDMEEFDRILGTMPENKVSPLSRKEFFDRTANTWSWLCAFDASENCISTQVARLDRLGSTTLGDHLTQQHRRVFSDHSTEHSEIGTRHADATYTITGDVSYQMEMRISAGGDGRYRDGELGGLLGSLFQLLIYNRWNPDCTYCLMSKDLIWKGFDGRCRFNHKQFMGTSWDVAPPGLNETDYIVYNRREDLESLPYELVSREKRKLLPIPGRPMSVGVGQ